MNDFGNNLKRVRKEKGLKQNELAKIMGVSPVVISQYEANKRNPKIETIRKFAEALNCSLEDFNVIETSWGGYAVDSIEIDGEIFPSISEAEDIIYSIDGLNDKGKRKVYDYIKDLEGNPKYKL